MSGWMMKSARAKERPFVCTRQGWPPLLETGAGHVQKPLCPQVLSAQKVLHKFISPGISLLTTRESSDSCLARKASTVGEPSWISPPHLPQG